jgi:enoyl-CoA hydratase/carnithine racemase
MADAPITLEPRDGATLVRMDDGKVNALSLDFLGTLGDRVDEALETGDPVVLTGNDTAFSAGLDLEEVPTLQEDGLRTLFDRFEAIVEPILKAPVPVVASLDGFAIAGGAIVALSCDYRVASPEAEIGATELQVGIPFPPTDLELFTERLPARTVRQTILDPRRSQGEEALQLGWVDELADEPVEAALAAATRLGGTNDAAFQDVKAQLNEDIIEVWEDFEGGELERYVDMLTSKETEQAIMQGIQNVMGD